MSFENCKQIEINGKVWNVDGFCTSDRRVCLSDDQVAGFYSVPIGFLEEIGAKPVHEMPKKGDKVVVWNCQESKYIRVANGRIESDRIGTYCMEARSSYEIWKNWKPFNPEELESEDNK